MSRRVQIYDFNDQAGWPDCKDKLSAFREWRRRTTCPWRCLHDVWESRCCRLINCGQSSNLSTRNKHN